MVTDRASMEAIGLHFTGSNRPERALGDRHAVGAGCTECSHCCLIRVVSAPCIL